jgi:Ham1 family
LQKPRRLRFLALSHNAFGIHHSIFLPLHHPHNSFILQFEMAPHELNFITGNANKLAEVKAILNGVIELKSQSLDLPEIQGTIEEVSKTKCKTAAEIVRNSHSEGFENFN